MTLDEIRHELSRVDDRAAVVVLVIAHDGGVPSAVRSMATDVTGLDLLAGVGSLLDTVSTRAMAADGAVSTEVAVQVELAGIHLGLAVDALLGARPGRRLAS